MASIHMLARAAPAIDESMTQYGSVWRELISSYFLKDTQSMKTTNKHCGVWAPLFCLSG